MRRGLRLGTALVLIGGCAGLSACQVTGRPPPEGATNVEAPAPAVTVVRVPRACVPRTLGPPPAYPDSDAALLRAAGAADRYQLMAAGRLLRKQRLEQLEGIVRRCR